MWEITRRINYNTARKFVEIQTRLNLSVREGFRFLTLAVDNDCEGIVGFSLSHLIFIGDLLI